MSLERKPVWYVQVNNSARLSPSLLPSAIDVPTFATITRCHSVNHLILRSKGVWSQGTERAVEALTGLQWCTFLATACTLQQRLYMLAFSTTNTKMTATLCALSCCHLCLRLCCFESWHMHLIQDWQDCGPCDWCRCNNCNVTSSEGESGAAEKGVSVFV